MSAIAHFLQTNPFSFWVYDSTLRTPDIPIWPIMHGLWSTYLVFISTENIYFSFTNKLFTTFLMSILQERFIVVFQDARNLTFDIKLEDFLKSLSLELLTVTIAWIILYFVSEKLPPIVIRILGLLLSLPNGTEKIRIFYFTFNYLSDIDPRVLMIICISFCFAPEILEILIRRITHQRSVSKYTNLRNLFIGFFIFLIAFQFLMKGSIISQILGRVRPSLVLQCLNFILPIYYIYLFLK